MSTFLTKALAYWTTLWQLLCWSPAIRKRLDTRLEEAESAAKWAAAWTALIGAGALLATRGEVWFHTLRQLPLLTNASEVSLRAITLILIPLLVPSAYGLLRLYTLVHHVLVLNVFKVRGQRLRLLNLFTTLLSLGPLAALGWVIYTHSPQAGLIWLSAVAVLAAVRTSLDYNFIFHQRRLGGLFLWIGGTVVTLFVLGIGLLAILIAIAVLAFFAVLVLRIANSNR